VKLIPHLRSALPALSVVAVVAAAAAVWHNLPTPTDVYGPFDVHAEVGAPATGRAVSATVTAVRIARSVNSVAATGQWVVVDTTLDAISSTELPHSELIVGPNTYTPSDRFFVDTLKAEIAPGISQRGAWVFDVAPELVAPGASESLMLHVWVGAGFIDSRLAIRIPTDDARVSRVDAVELQPPVESAS
jgi:hypothetical protein